MAGQEQPVPKSLYDPFPEIADERSVHENRPMGDKVDQLKDEFDEFVIQRLESLLADMGWELKFFCEKIYEKLGYQQPKAMMHRFKRGGSRRLEGYMHKIIGKELGVDPAYIAGLHNDLEGTLDKFGTYNLVRENRQLKSTQ